MPLKPIKKKRLFEEIVLAIEEYIQEEHIKPGDKLPSESGLAEIFNVSKTAVREAMTVLHANGIIEKKSGAGIFLRAIDGETIAQRVTENLMKKEELREILEFRRGLETEAVFLAAIRASEQDLYMIKQAHEKLVEANRNGAIGVEEDYMFHYSVIVASHNSIYKSVFDSISEKFEEGIRVSKMQSAKLPGRYSETDKEHQQIIEALYQRNQQLASESMRNHLVRNEKKLWTNIKS